MSVISKTKQVIARSRSILTIGLAALSLGACDDPLAVDIVGTITGDGINSAASANALRIGALSSLNAMTAGGTALFGPRGWIDADLLTDVWKTSSPRQQNGELDVRNVPNTSVNLQANYAEMHRARARAREAVNALEKFMPSPAWGIGQMYVVMGLAELQLAEYFCNGVPMSEFVDGRVVYGPPLTNQAIFNVASAHLDSAITYLGATDATTAQLLNVAKLLKARVLVDLGQWAAAATQVAGIPTAFAYPITFSLTTGDNAIWTHNTSVRDLTVGDSVDATGTVANALPFASANDPRVRVLGSSTGTSSQGRGADGSTNLVVTNMWGRSDAVNLVSGLDARLIEAEAQLQANNLTGMTATRNALRAAPPALTPSYTPTAMPPLAAPPNQAAAITLFFREKAFWTFGRGQRLGDLRRLIRQYGRTQDQTFPVGTFFKGGTYGTNVNFDVSSLELNNSNFTACLDRNA